MAITGVLGRLLIELGANTARLQSDMGKAVGIAEKAAGKIKAAFKFAGGGLIGAALANTVRQSIQFGDEIQKAATKAGIGGKAMSELAYAAKLADVDVASLSTAIKKMQVSLSEAGTGAKGPTQALAALGLTIQQVQARRPDQQFELLAQRISDLKDPADRARAATELFGKAGADLLPLFEQGAAGIRKAREEAQKLGLSFSDKDLSKLATADDSIKRLGASWQGFATTLTANVAPALSSILDTLSGIDSRNAAQKLDDQIADLEGQISRRAGMSGRGNADAFAARTAEMRAQLAALQARRALAGAGPLTEQGGRRSVRPTMPLGYGAVAAADAAAEAAEKARKAAEKSRAEALKDEEKARKEHVERILDINEKRIDNEIEYEMEKRRQAFDDAIAKENELADARKRIAKQQNEAIQTFKDAFLNAWDDMVNTGKFKWGELLKFMVAEFARRGITKLIDGMFDKANGTASSGSGGGFWAGLGSIFGFAKGGRPPVGRPSWVGEEGKELFVPDQAGTIIPNNMFGGGKVITLAPVYNIDARGASADLAKALPSILRQNNRELESTIVQKLKSGWYD